jgi:hypothetical protein
MDFYTKILEKTEYYFNKYDPKVCTFFTYFTTVLHNAWKNFSGSQKTKYVSMQPLSNDSVEKSDYDMRLAYTDTPEKTAIRQEYSEEDTFADVHDTFTYLVLKCFYFDFFTEDDFVLLKNHTGKSYLDCLEFTEKIMTDLHKRRKKSALAENALTRIYKNLIAVQKRLQYLKVQHTGDAIYLDELHEKEERLKETQAQYIVRYNKIRSHPSYKTIAGFFNVTTKKIANIVQYFKKKKKYA